MAVIKLYYFNSRGRGEICRLLLAASGTQWEDVRIDHDKWPEYKKNAPFGQAPYLQYNDKYYGQTVAIANFIAREFGLVGKTNLETFKVDEVVQLVQDLLNLMVKIFYEKDEAKKTELYEKLKTEDVPKFFNFFEKLLKENGSNGHFVGKGLTMADVYVYDSITALEQMLKLEAPDKGYPDLQKLRATVEAHPNIKKYLEERTAKGN